MNGTKTKTWTLAFLAVFVFAIPISLSAMLNIPIHKTLSLIVSTFALEYLAVPVGIGLGLSPVFVLIVVTSVALSVVLLLFTIFEIIGEKSKRVSNFLSKSRAKADNSKLTQKYGIYGLVPGVIILGFYVCPAVAWVLGWRKDYATILIILGFVFISTIIMFTTIGGLELILK